MFRASVLHLAYFLQIAELTAHVIDAAVHMCQELPRPLTSKALTAKFLAKNEQVSRAHHVFDRDQECL
jgi:hypothetical protein